MSNFIKRFFMFGILAAASITFAAGTAQDLRITQDGSGKPLWKGIQWPISTTMQSAIDSAANSNNSVFKAYTSEGRFTDARFALHSSSLVNYSKTLKTADVISKGPLVDVRAFANLSTAKANTSTAGKPILIASATSINTATIPSDRVLKVEKGGIITVNSGKTLTINGSFEAGRYPCFAGSGTVVFGPGAVASIAPEWFGAIATAFGTTTNAATNFTAITKAIASTSAIGGTIAFGSGWYYVDDAIMITTNGMRFTGVGSAATAISKGTHIATTSTTKDVIQVNDSIDAVEGFEMRNIVVVGNSSGTTGSGLKVKASNAHAISKISLHNCTFNSAAEYGILFDADTANSFIFNCYMSEIMTRSNKLDGIKITGAVSQVQIDSLYTENNLHHGVHLLGGSVHANLKNITFNRLTLSIVPDGYAGLNIEYADFIDVFSIYSEDVSGDNIRLRSVKGFKAIGGSLQQVISTSYGVVIGNDAANHPNTNHYIDIPGWTNTSSHKLVDLTRYPGGVVVDGLTLVSYASGQITNSNIEGYDTVFYLNRINFLHPSYDTPTIEAQSGAGTSAAVALVTGARDLRGEFTLRQGTGAWGAGAQARITFAHPFAIAPIVNLMPSNSSSVAATQNQTNKVSVRATTTYFDIVFDTAVSAQPAFAGQWAYAVTP